MKTKKPKYHHTGIKNPCGHDAPVIHKPIVNVCSVCGQTWARNVIPDETHAEHVTLLVVSVDDHNGIAFRPGVPMLLPSPDGSALSFKWCDVCGCHQWHHIPKVRQTQPPLDGGFNL